MKQTRLNIGFAIAAATLTTTFLNVSSLNRWEKPKHSVQTALELVNEASRISHAKELLGTEFIGSDAQKMSGNTLHENIQQTLQAALPPKFKLQAHNIAKTIISESTKYGMDPIFVLAIIKTESKFNPMVIGRHGEIGLMQIKPTTAQWISTKFNLPWKGKKTLENPSSNIKIGLAYTNYLRNKFDRKALRYVSAYNMGPTNLRRLLSNNQKPAEYNQRVMKNYAEIYARITESKKSAGTLVAAN